MMQRATKLVLVMVSAMAALMVVVTVLVNRHPVPVAKVLVGLIVAVGAAAALRLPAPTRANVVLLGCSVYGTLFAIDWGLAYLKVEPRQNLLAALRDGVPYDRRTQLQVVRDLRRSGVDAYPTTLPRMYLDLHLTRDGRPFLPLSGLSSSILVQCNELGEMVVFRSDEHGFRNPEGLYAAGRPDVALIGDSFTHGNCVPEGQEIAAGLRSLGLSVINLGQGGDGPLAELATLREYAAPLAPRAVIWCYFEQNDLTDLQRERKNPVLPLYLDPAFSQGLMAHRPYIDSLIRGFIAGGLAPPLGRQARALAADTYRHLKLAELREPLRAVFERPKPFRVTPADMAQFSRILALAQAETAGWGGRLYFVYLPQFGRFVDSSLASPHRAEVLALVDSLGIPTFDASAAFTATGDPTALFPFRRQNHYTGKGYRLVAEGIAALLRDSGPVAAALPASAPQGAAPLRTR